jgi:hypothetical protein
MLFFPLAQAQAHLEHHPTMGESYHVLAFPLTQVYTHIEQDHSNVGQS